MRHTLPTILIKPGQSLEDYQADLAKIDHVTYHAQRREEIKLMALKSGWCMTNHHHICPKEYVDKKVPACDCPCHLADDDLLADLVGAPAPEPEEEEIDGMDLI